MKNYNLILIVSIMLFTACESGDYDLSINKSIKFSAQIEQSQTRATDDKWDKGDAIGIYMKENGDPLDAGTVIAKNAKYTTTGNGMFTSQSSTHDLTFPLDKSKVDFVAYYPYGSVNSAFEYSFNLTDQSNQGAIDLLYSNNARGLNSSSAAVELNFDHKLAKMVVNLAKTGGSINNVSVTIKGMNSKGKLSLTDGSVTSTTKANIKMKANSKDAVAEAIVMPAESLDGIELEILNGKDGYRFKLSDAVNIKSLEAGYKHTYDITLDDTPGGGISASASISKWAEGPKESVTLPKDFEDETGGGNTGGETEGDAGEVFSIEQARELEGKKDVWVEGYIVGYYTGSTYKSFTNDLSGNTKISESNLALAQSPDEDAAENTFPVELPDKDIRYELSLYDYPDNLGRKVKVKGNLETYFGLTGMKATKDYVFLTE